MVIRNVTGGGTISNIIAIRSTNRTALLDVLHALRGNAQGTEVKLGGVVVPTINQLPTPPFLKVGLPCGCTREWESPADVPDYDVPCNCGNLPYPHYFLKYDDLRRVEWKCQGCGKTVHSEEVTYGERHDLRAGGCGGLCL